MCLVIDFACPDVPICIILIFIRSISSVLLVKWLHQLRLQSTGIPIEKNSPLRLAQLPHGPPTHRVLASKKNQDNYFSVRQPKREKERASALIEERLRPHIGLARASIVELCVAPAVNFNQQTRLLLANYRSNSGDCLRYITFQRRQLFSQDERERERAFATLFLRESTKPLLCRTAERLPRFGV